MAKDPLRTDKLSPLFEGPYKIVRKHRSGTYALMNHDQTLLGRDYAPSQLIPVPAPTIPSGNDVFTVDHILQHRKKGRSYDYLVHWKGHDNSHDSWEPAENFFDTAVISKYWKSQSG